MQNNLDSVVVENEQTIEGLVMVFRDTLHEIQSNELLSPETWEKIISQPEEVATLFERFLVKKSDRLNKVYFKRLPDKLKIKELSGACPCVDYAKEVRLIKRVDWEIDIISMLGGNTIPTPETEVEVYESNKEMSIHQAFSRLATNYELAALSKAQVRYFCLNYRYFLKDEKNHLVFLIKNFYQTRNGESNLMGVIAKANKQGIHLSIKSEKDIVSSKNEKGRYIFIVPINSN